LNWTFFDPDGDTQAAKQVQVSPSAIFSTITHDSGKVENSSQAYTLPVGSGLEFGNKTYYWRVKVWDSRGAESSWIKAPDSQNLVTPGHAYPDPDFTWTPQNPGQHQEVQFIDKSIAGGFSNIVRWAWTFPDANPPFSALQNPIVIFSTAGKKTVTLTVWDSNNYSCPIQKEINVATFAPVWREIAPW
jgi:PKD repeat protein